MNPSASTNAVAWNGNLAGEPGTSITMPINSQLASGRGPKSKKYFKIVFCLVCLFIIFTTFVVGFIIYQGMQMQKEFVNEFYKGFNQVTEGSNKKINDYPFESYDPNKIYIPF